jgi:hypothetical protein
MIGTKKKLITHTDLHKPNNKLVSAYLEHLWCMDKPCANTNSHNLPWLGLGGSHYLSPLKYTLCMATWPAPKCHFVQGLPSGSPEIPKTRTLGTLEAHNVVCTPSIEVRSKVKL